jgi:hypothetical protein
MKETAMRLILILLMFLASPLYGLTPNEVVAKFPLVQEGACTDNESGERGHCFIFDTGDGIYLVFTQNGEPVLMRRVVNGTEGFTEVWRAPAGTSL